MSDILGVTLSKVGPGASETAMFCPLIPKEGIRAMANTRMPMPPIQWVKERQKSMLLGRASISERMEAPVVEKPEQVSKKASTKFGIL